MLVSGGHACWKVRDRCYIISHSYFTSLLWWFICQKILQLFFLLIHAMSDTVKNFFSHFVGTLPWSHRGSVGGIKRPFSDHFYTRLQCLLTFHKSNCIFYLHEIIDDGMQIIKILHSRCFEEFFQHFYN